MKIALLGLPQSGKRTLFSLLTGRNIAVNPRNGKSLEGKAAVRDLRVDEISRISNPEKITYAETDVVLCPDVDPGSGSEWLNEARLADLLCIVVREFGSEEVYHPDGSVDSLRDKANLEAELILADLELAEKRIERIEKDKRRFKLSASQLAEEGAIIKCRAALDEGEFAGGADLTPEELATIKSLNFLTLKPVIWCSNVNETALASSNGHNGFDFKVSALIEKEIMSLDDENDRNEFMSEIGIEVPGLDRLNSAAYDRLGLMSFYTMGEDEVRAWTIRKGSPAPSAGGKIHTDIERGFIRLEVFKYDDLITYGSENGVKSAGKALLKGKDYIIEDGDICAFRFNV